MHKLQLLMAKITIEEKTMATRNKAKACTLPVFESPGESETPDAKSSLGSIFDAFREIEDLDLKKASRT